MPDRYLNIHKFALDYRYLSCQVMGRWNGAVPSHSRYMSHQPVRPKAANEQGSLQGISLPILSLCPSLSLIEI